MSSLFFALTIVFIVISAAMILIILVQRAQGGGLAGAFGGAGGAGTDTVFGGRVGDALTWATVIAFALYLLFAITLNKVEPAPTAAPATTEALTPLEDAGTGTGTAGTEPAPTPTTPAPATPESTAPIFSPTTDAPQGTPPDDGGTDSGSGG